MTDAAVRACGCTYRDTGKDLGLQLWWWFGAVSFALTEEATEGMTWGELCNRLRANTDAKRDGLHRLLHSMATPTITPAAGPGRKGTLWHMPPSG